MKHITLNNEVRIPQLGFGTYLIPDEEVADAVEHALKAHYRSIDTAQYYENETGVGEAIKKSGIPRNDLFITTKVWNSHHGYDNTLRAFETSLKNLKLDYIDLYLIHWPAPKKDMYIETYKAMEELYKDGKIRAIGVCNFQMEHLERLMKTCEIVPTVNQIECHPYLQQKELKDFCKQHNIYVQSWGPLFQGGELLTDNAIITLSKKHNKSPAQIILRWHVQENCIVIPKSVTPTRIKENIDIFDFELSKDDMELIAKLNRNERRGAHPNDK